MMRKTYLVILGAVAGAAVALLVTQPHGNVVRLGRKRGRLKHLSAA